MMRIIQYCPVWRVALLVVGVCTLFSKGWGAEMHHNADVLWGLVQTCSKDAEHHHPCVLYKERDGYVLLKDREGKEQFLTIPSQRVTGIESSILLKNETPSYLSEAWSVRDYASQAYGRSIPDDILSLAINSERARSQNQLHIHIDCMDKRVHEIIQNLSIETGEGEVLLKGHHYRWKVIDTLDPSPFVHEREWLFHNEDQEKRGKHGIFVAYHSGKFLLLESTAHWIDWGGAEELQDHQCHIMHVSR